MTTSTLGPRGSVQETGAPTQPSHRPLPAHSGPVDRSRRRWAELRRGDYEKGELNTAATEWVFPPGTEDAREPWVFVVGRDGRITHRFDNVASDAELEQAVVELTR